MRKYTLTGLFLCVFVFFGYSQTTATHTVRIIAKPILELQLENPGATPEFNFNTLADYVGGIEKLQAASLKIRANRNWVLNVKSGSENFITTDNQATTISSSVLTIRKSGTSEDFAISSADQAITNGSAGGFDKNKISLDFKANPGFISPETYSIELTYTLTAP
ncbi:MAG: hypothetical protein U0V04_15280 [Spirosomataceae bacterium]|jgi:hypothetical protein